MRTIDYYNEHAQEFVDRTVDSDMHVLQDLFLEELSACCGENVLDFGCGSGRDSKYFKEHGCNVTALDGSKELCRVAEEISGVPVKEMLFEDFCEKDMYDGIWASASLLHIASDELPGILSSLIEALCSDGILLMSFKYGDTEGMEGERFFNYMNETRIYQILQKTAGFENCTLKKVLRTKDVREDEEWCDIEWLNVLVKKK